MAKSAARVALLSSASTALMLFLAPGVVAAQSTTCSQAGTSITCVDGATTVLTGTASIGTTVVPGPGLTTLNGTTASTIIYNAAGPVSTTNVRAVSLTSTGGALTFGPAANSAPVNIRTTGGVGANGLTLDTTGNAATVTVGTVSTTGTSSFGVLSSGADLTLRTGDITTTGLTSRGIQVAQTGAVNIVAGNLSTTDRAIQVIPGANSDATVVAGNITSGTSGALVNGNNVRITTGNISAANGFGVVGQSSAGTTGSVTIRTGDVTSSGAFGVGGTVFNTVGGVNIGCGRVTSNSAGSAAVFAQNNGSGALTVNCGAVTNVGNNAVFVRSFGAPDGGNIAITTTSAASSNTNFSTIFAQTNGSGTITVDAGTVTGGASAAGQGATGIDLIGGTGAINAGYGNVTTVGTALRSISAGTLNLRGAAATLQTSGAGATGAVINANGVTGSLGNLVTTGAGSQGAVITSTAPVNLTIGSVATTGNGVTINAGANAVALTTGTVTATESGATGTVINSTGAVNFTGARQVANGANALRINGGAGAINATVAGAATTGVGTAVAITGTGPLTFANTGAITTTGAGSSGLTISGVTTAAVNCGNVSTTGANSPAVVVAANGNTNVTCGTVSTTGAASDAIGVTNTAGTTTVTGGTTSATGAGSRGIVVSSSAPAAGNLVTVNTGGVTANGNAVTAAATSGAGVLVNATGNVTSSNGTGITVATGGTSAVTIGAGTTTSGSVGGINSTAVGGTAITNAGVIGSTGGFAIDVNGGAATISNSGTLNGRIDLTANADTFTNATGGRFNAIGTSDFGLGADTFNNGGVLTAFSSATFNGLETFNNTGLVDLRDGVTDDILTLTGATFTGGAGSQLGLDVNFANNASDRLVIGTAAGGTTILLNNTAPGTTPLLNLNGIVLVDATAATASNFQLGGTSDFGFTRANLVFDSATSNFRLTTVPDTEVFETSRYGAGMTNAWNQSGDAWSARMTELRDVAFSRLEERPDGFEMWAQGYAGSEGQDQLRSFNLGGTPTSFDLSYDQDFQGFQLGGDVQRSMGWGKMVFGLTGGVIKSDQAFNSGNSFELQGGNIGAYAGLYAGGFFLNGLVKADRYEATVISSTAFFRDETEATTVGAKAEAGYRMGLGGFFVEPVVALAYTDSDLDDLSVPGGVFTFEDSEGLRGEAGVRVGGDFAMGSSRIQPFIGVFAVDELRGENTAVFTSGSTSFGLQDLEPETYGKVSVGLNLLEQDGVNLFVRGDALFSGEAKGGSVRIGARWSF